MGNETKTRVQFLYLDKFEQILMVLVSLVFLFYLFATLHLFDGFWLEVVGDL